jgi:dTDP-4-dehydrorhamnose 3,5-epimerase
MKFVSTPLESVYVIELDRLQDERGFFARTCCQREFQSHHIRFNIVQSSISHSINKGIIRGLHFQISPCAEAKVVSCIRGSLFDVVVDLRKDSKSFKRSFSVELNESNRRQIYIPEGCAHGFQVLSDSTDVLYFMSAFFSPDHARGIRFDDPELSIPWPLEERKVSKRDAELPMMASFLSSHESF